MEKIKVCFILSQGLPVPAVKGGAVEILAENMAIYNEKYKYLDLTIVSKYDEKAKIKSNVYHETHWIYIKKNKIDKISDYLFRIIRRVTNKSFCIGTYDRKVLNVLKKEKYDRIVFEGGNVFFASHYHQYFSREKLLYHFHCVERPNYKLYKFVAGTIGISQYVLEVLLQHCIFPENRNYVLLNGIEIDKFAKKISNNESYALKDRWGIKEEDFLLLYVGRLLTVKGIKECMQAIMKIHNSKIKLLVIGEGTRFNFIFINELKKIAKKSNKRIQLVGYVANELLYQYYQIADCVIMPSICEEGAGLVQSEAYAAGKPVIATDIGGIPEYQIKEGSILVKYDNKFVVNLSNAILQMKNKVELGKINKKILISKSKTYSAEQYYLNYVKILQKDIK